MSELSVREMAAWAVRETVRLNERATWLDTADAVLAAVAAHDGLAEVLREHGRDHTAVVGDDLWCATCDRIIGHADHREDHHAAHLADVVRAWLRGES